MFELFLRNLVATIEEHPGITAQSALHHAAKKTLEEVDASREAAEHTRTKAEG